FCTAREILLLSSNLLALGVAVNGVLQIGQSRQNLVKTYRLGEIHISHRLVIAAERGQPFGRRDKAECTGICLIVARPCTAEESALPLNDPVAKLVVVYRFASYWVRRQCSRVRVMARKPIRRQPVSRTVKLSV